MLLPKEHDRTKVYPLSAIYPEAAKPDITEIFPDSDPGKPIIIV